MLNKKGQANIIAVIGMVAAVIFVLMNAFNYANSVGLSSQIEITAQTSIYQSVAVKDYLIQQANYLFDQAQLFDAFDINPSTTSVNCGYINTTTRLPFIPVDKVYYWRNSNGQFCLPNNQEILYGLMQLLNQTRFSFVNTSGLNIQSYLDLNLTKTLMPGVFSGTFTAPYLNDKYTIYYDRGNLSGASIQIFDNGPVNNPDKDNLIFSGPVGTVFMLNQSQFSSTPESDVITGVLSAPALKSSFFNGQVIDAPSGPVLLAPDSQYSLITFPSGITAMVYSTKVAGVNETFITPLVDQNVYSLGEAEDIDIKAGVAPATQLFNNTEFTFEGTQYNFTLTNYPNGIFNFFPENYAILPLEPNFVYYRYIINDFELSQGENLLFPNYQPLSVSLSLFPLYNPQVCVSYNEVQFSVQNCISVSGYITTTDYLSQLMQIGVAFVNQSFPLGNMNITGFAQYALYNYIQNVVHGVNLKTVSVNGQPKYDWYSAMLLSLGSIQNGAAYLIGKLNKVAEPYFGTTVYNCSQSASDLSYCSTLLSQTLEGDLENLLDYQVPVEVSFLSAEPFNINILNLTASLRESPTCPSYGGYSPARYNATVNYSFDLKAPTYTNFTSETLGIPISFNFGYQNTLNLTPTESCGITNSPYVDGYPGFTQTIVSPDLTYLNCAQVVPMSLINTTCVADLETASANTATITALQNGGANCVVVKGNAAETYCQNYKFNPFISSPANAYQNWLTNSNSCPSYVFVNGGTSGGDNFTFQQSGGLNQLLSVYGGGDFNIKDNPQNWTFAAIDNGSFSVPTNFSVYAGVEASGPSPGFNLILGSNNNLETGLSTVFQLNSGLNPNTVYEYNSASNGLIQLAPEQSSTFSAGENNIEVDTYGSASSGYTMNFFVNSVQQSQITSKAVSVNDVPLLDNPLKFLAFSTDNLPTSDVVNYFFVTDYIKGYTPINTLYSSQPTTSLNSELFTTFGLTPSSYTYYNLVLLNPISFNTQYQLSLTLDSNFNYAYGLSPQSLKIFGVSANDTVRPLFWWNETQLQQGGVIWIALPPASSFSAPQNVPVAVYVVYGPGAYSVLDSDYDIGQDVFPVFYSNQTARPYWLSTYVHTALASPRPSFGENGLNLIKIGGPESPNVYNSTLNSLFGQFACITIKPSLQIVLLNATYSPYPAKFNINNLYPGYNPSYPDLNVIGVSSTYTSWDI